MKTRFWFRAMILALFFAGVLLVHSTAQLVHRSARVDQSAFVVADSGTPTPTPQLIDCEDGTCGG
ncbi:MAG: hypothetical protein GXP42_13270 [Chloroflexi bacterium]|nr:hypothetical protein [Chloroflexota bacterium]